MERTFEEDHGVSGLPVDYCGEERDIENEIRHDIWEMEKNKEATLCMVHAFEEMEKAERIIKNLHERAIFDFEITLNGKVLSKEEVIENIRERVKQIQMAHDELAKIERGEY